MGDKIDWRYISNIFLRSLSLLIVILTELLILLGHSSSSNMFLKIAKRLFKGSGEKVKFVCGPRTCLLLHKNLLECSWCNFEILLESVKCDLE
jgi:hypothetical protein